VKERENRPETSRRAGSRPPIVLVVASFLFVVAA